MALRTAGLAKRYGRVVVLDGLDLGVGAGGVQPSPVRTVPARLQRIRTRWDPGNVFHHALAMQLPA